MLGAGIGALVFAPLEIRAADTVAVPRSELEATKREMAEMRVELNALKAKRGSGNAQSRASLDGPRAGRSGALALLTARVDELARAAELSGSSKTKMHLGGEAEATFAAGEGSASNFDAGFSPVLLWNVSSDLLFEGKVTFTLDDHGTEVSLRYAHLDWSLGDYVTLIGGKFLSPINVFRERYEPSWINKLPTSPFGTDNGILPETNLGFQLRAAVPVAAEAKLNFALYISNAPALKNSEYRSRLDFTEYGSARDQKAVGGRVSLELYRNFEIGYGVQGSRAAVKGDNFYVYGDDLGANLDRSFRDRDSIRSMQQSVDFQVSVEALKGRWSLSGQYAWTDSDDFAVTRIYPALKLHRGYGVRGPDIFVAGGLIFIVPSYVYFPPSLSLVRRYSTTRFSSHRDGGYVQLSYRGTSFPSDFLNRLEVIARFDRQDSATEMGADIDRLTVGLDYWIAPATVLKTAYEVTHLENVSAGKSEYGRFLFGIAVSL